MDSSSQNRSREVFFGGVGQHGDDDGVAAGGGFFAGDLEAGDDGGGGGDADQQAFVAGQAAGHVVGGFGFHLELRSARWGL